MTPQFRVFYCHNATGDAIAASAPEPIASDRIPSLANDVLEDIGDFLGLIDGDGGVLQFIYVADPGEDDRPIRMDMPDRSRRSNLIRRVSEVELYELLSDLPCRLTPDRIDGEAGQGLDLVDDLDHMERSAQRGIA